VDSLATGRLVLPAWDERFAEDLARMSSDERIMRYAVHGVWTPEYAAQRHADAIRHWARHGFGWRAILCARTGTFLGLGAVDWLRDPVPGVDRPALEIGWWTEPVAWGYGIATEAGTALLEEAFRRTPASLAVARCLPANVASERVMTKLGMTRFPDVSDPYGAPVRLYGLYRPSP
jgi:RimJ/RimL family protein N-acetyltransferase